MEKGESPAQQTTRSAAVVGTELRKSVWESAGEGGPANVWGFRILFSDGREAVLPDFCDREEDARRFLERLAGRDFPPEYLADLADDYLGEIYGLPMT
ncbi:MAG TPA: hypothetical protein H9684_08175 [Firmicutes bacterium]|nr:hypothetical protein [Bacillota bacterium]